MREEFSEVETEPGRGVPRSNVDEHPDALEITERAENDERYPDRWPVVKRTSTSTPFDLGRPAMSSPQSSTTDTSTRRWRSSRRRSPSTGSDECEFPSSGFIGAVGKSGTTDR